MEAHCRQEYFLYFASGPLEGIWMFYCEGLIVNLNVYHINLPALKLIHDFLIQRKRELILGHLIVTG